MAGTQCLAYSSARKKIIFASGLEWNDYKVINTYIYIHLYGKCERKSGKKQTFLDACVSKDFDISHNSFSVLLL